MVSYDIGIWEFYSIYGVGVPVLIVAYWYKCLPVVDTNDGEIIPSTVVPDKPGNRLTEAYGATIKKLFHHLSALLCKNMLYS